ncbi:DNA polymerase III subunit delta' [Ignavibacterium album JCM 16511]|uniref:DNA polymerase III subunit delta n=1 Tax=Ignavibacterium album (strain DSM 19864 / JCM 16511 / NBRC 101810 / Mat9-16) TaxID=945713 RepID=I0AJX2_IGNAJ|nr:AAA family ATPase [Ignavibacterium album]AFH49279.1 DNA polymerase III subunit delta' [Ignavibacterium album JCM 16511]
MINPLNKIIGQEKVKLILEKIISSGKISHAFLFRGLEGVGKEDVAIRFAQAIVFSSNIPKEKKQNYISQIDKLTEPFIKYIFPLPRGKNEVDDDNPYEKLKQDEIELIQEELAKKATNHFYKIQIPKANNIKINSIRDINRFLSLSYDESIKRVIIISDAHLMNEPAQNALLKNLEEPPANIIFILCTSYPERLRETIISRCWNLNFQPLDQKEVEKVLNEKFEIDDSLARKISLLSNGSVTQGLKILNYGLEELKENVIKILRYSFGKKFYSAYKEFENIGKDSDTEYLEIIISLLIHWLNDFNKFRTSSGEIVFRDYQETFEKFYSRYPDINLLPLANRLDEISTRLKNNINLNLAISNIICEISSVIPAK